MNVEKAGLKNMGLWKVLKLRRKQVGMAQFNANPEACEAFRNSSIFSWVSLDPQGSETLLWIMPPMLRPLGTPEGFFPEGLCVESHTQKNVLTFLTKGIQIGLGTTKKSQFYVIYPIIFSCPTVFWTTPYFIPDSRSPTQTHATFWCITNLGIRLYAATVIGNSRCLQIRFHITQGMVRREACHGMRLCAPTEMLFF